MATLNIIDDDNVIVDGVEYRTTNKTSKIQCCKGCQLSDSHACRGLRCSPMTRKDNMYVIWERK